MLINSNCIAKDSDNYLMISFINITIYHLYYCLSNTSRMVSTPVGTAVSVTVMPSPVAV